LAQKHEIGYLDLQAEMGITKHMGGIKATIELIELCRISNGDYVLDVGCGVGTTSIRLARDLNCRVMGVDISEKMIEWSEKRAGDEKVDDKTEFKVASALDLPFEDNTFDAVIVESVTAFLEDKKKAVDEYRRVVKEGGYIGLNECTWIEKPPKEPLDYFNSFAALGGEGVLDEEGWRSLLEEAGLHDISVHTRKVSALGEFRDRVKLLGIRRILSAWWRLIFNSFMDVEYRKYIREAAREAKSLRIKGFTKYAGYGIYVGTK
jgi:ubiquinone/menaquinone biosynthesis C-methylase UbiE